MFIGNNVFRDQNDEPMSHPWSRIGPEILLDLLGILSGEPRITPLNCASDQGSTFKEPIWQRPCAVPNQWLRLPTLYQMKSSGSQQDV